MINRLRISSEFWPTIFPSHTASRLWAYHISRQSRQRRMSVHRPIRCGCWVTARPSSPSSCSCPCYHLEGCFHTVGWRWFLVAQTLFLSLSLHGHIPRPLQNKTSIIKLYTRNLSKHVLDDQDKHNVLFA